MSFMLSNEYIRLEVMNAGMAVCVGVMPMSKARGHVDIYSTIHFSHMTSTIFIRGINNADEYKNT